VTVRKDSLPSSLVRGGTGRRPAANGVDLLALDAALRTGTACGRPRAGRTPFRMHAIRSVLFRRRRRRLKRVRDIPCRRHAPLTLPNPLGIAQRAQPLTVSATGPSVVWAVQRLKVSTPMRNSTR
jgi:hypothetical protein